MKNKEPSIGDIIKVKWALLHPFHALVVSGPIKDNLMGQTKWRFIPLEPIKASVARYSTSHINETHYVIFQRGEGNLWDNMTKNEQIEKADNHEV